VLVPTSTATPFELPTSWTPLSNVTSDTVPRRTGAQRLPVGEPGVGEGGGRDEGEEDVRDHGAGLRWSWTVNWATVDDTLRAEPALKT
jgi:hypothetical protein